MLVEAVDVRYLVILEILQFLLEVPESMVGFDSNNKPNMQQKTVTLSANTQSGRETLRIKAMVSPILPKKQNSALPKHVRQQANN